MRVLGLPDTIAACLFDLDGVLTKTADEHVDGKPRVDGVRGPLAARGIAPDEKLARALADRKNDLVLAMMRRDGVEAYDGSVRFGFVVGVDRSGQADALRARGADVVAADLAELLDRP